MNQAPRPGYQLAHRAYRLGLPRPVGYRWLSGPSWYYRPRRHSPRRPGW
jgi:hypothetical protein